MVPLKLQYDGEESCCRHNVSAARKFIVGGIDAKGCEVLLVERSAGRLGAETIFDLTMEVRDSVKTFSSEALYHYPLIGKFLIFTHAKNTPCALHHQRSFTRTQHPRASSDKIFQTPA